MNIGDKIKIQRLENGLSQDRLAEKLGTTQDTVSLWELGKRLPDVESLVKLCRLFDVSADYLLGLEKF